MGVCRFCGQAVIPEDGKPDIPELYCSCDDAKRFRYRKELMDTAAEKIDFLFGELKDGFTGYGDVPISATVRKTLNDMVPLLLDGYIKSITVTVPNICTATIKMAGEKIKISRRQSKAVQETV